MTGWRNFGIELTDEVMLGLVGSTLRKEKKRWDTEEIDGYFVALMPGYGEKVPPDPEFAQLLETSSLRGYYIMANDTTDTADGYIRFQRGREMINVSDLVDTSIRDDDQAVLDGKDSKLPEFQLETPGYWIVYELLDWESLPFIHPFER